MGIMRKLAAVALAAGASIAYYQPTFHMPTSVSDLKSPSALITVDREFTGGWTGHHDSHADSHSFLSVNDDGTPARFNPCAPIRYVINDSHAEPGAVDDVTEAFARLAAVTGLTFEFVGMSDAIPTETWGHQSGTGGLWAPVLIGWVPSDVTDLLTGSEAAVGGPDVGIGADGKVLVSGSVALDADKNSDYPPGFGFGPTRGGLLMHELAHVVGLGHVDDSSQIMFDKSGQRPAKWGAGDIAGLHELGGAGGCLDVPAPPA